MNIILNSKDNIENMIYEIRGKQVMLDSDLAKLYKVETKRINEAVKNNPEKFPERFSWILSQKEWTVLRSKFSTLKNNENGTGKHRKYLPRVFTEQGVAMLATVLKSKTATEVSIRIMDTFVLMRYYVSEDLLMKSYYNDMVVRHDSEIKKIQDTLDKMQNKKVLNEIYYNGQIYDSYSKIIDIFYDSKKELIIIDSYADKTVLDIISRLNVNVIIITKKNNLLKKIDIDKYNSQYNNLKVIFNDDFHDRYFIIDKKILYHCGTSLNRIGCRTFSINLISDNKLINNFIGEIEKIL